MRTTSLNVLILFNTASSAYREGLERVQMYLDHFGVPCDGIDLLRDPLPAGVAERPLVILAHPGLDPTGHRLGSGGLTLLRDALRTGTGVVSFDPHLAFLLMETSDPKPGVFSGVEVAKGGHPITGLHPPGQAFGFDIEVTAPSVPGEALLTAGGKTFLGAALVGEGRLVTWASTGWMDTRVLGPLCGMDDLFWRGLVWAARKPFFLRGLPPLVTMRVDDVAGRGVLWDKNPLYWVEDCARLGWKPWLGLFIYNNSPETVRQLKTLIPAGQATAFPHALGRPNRGSETSFYYYEDAIPLRSDTYDEFIFFDHHHGVPWPDAEAVRSLRAVDRWLEAHAPLPVSRVALPHWYEMGSNTVRHVHERWGCDMLGKSIEADLPLTAGVLWLPLGPFRRYEPPGECHPFTPGQRGGRPVYYADFINLQGCRFFNSMTEIRDDAGYEWSPDNDVSATAARGIRQLRRALDSMAMASLFTHETDHIYKIRPENWLAIMEGVTRGIANYHPRLVTVDEGMQVLRASKTSRLEQVSMADTGVLTVLFSGQADCPTTFYRYDDDSLEGCLIDVPAFDNGLELRVTLSN